MSTLGDVTSEQPVKLIVGVLTAIPDQTDQIYSQLVAQFGQIDFQSQWLPFENTDYYQAEIGDHLSRQFLSFWSLIDPGQLANIKLFTNTIERRFSENGQRRFNLDPGYITPSKLVLATTKNFAHRIYLHSGIFAEITLRYHQKRFCPQEWTYPDYRTEPYIYIFEQIRQNHLAQLNQDQFGLETGSIFNHGWSLLSNKQQKYIIGLMSGTSVDGVDAALVLVSGNSRETEVDLVESTCYPFSAELRQRIFDLFQPKTSRIDEVCQVNFLIGRAFAEAAMTVAKAAKLPIESVDLIGSHGQTVYHLPPSSQQTSSTLQIGESAVIANLTGVPVVSDFRVADLALGGHGAPLVPYVDFLLYSQPNRSIALQNIGGISNVTFIPANAGPSQIVAFDSGPGNMIVDATVEILTDGQQRFDNGGKMAAKGKVNQSLLTSCLNHPYLQLSPPKSTGREEFGHAFARQAFETAQSLQIPAADLLATLTFFSAQTMADHYQKFLPPSIDEIRISGGGVHNQTLIANLSTLLKNLFETASIAIDEISDAKEAVAFAILANETVSGNCANLPQVTGASQPTILGKITLVP